MATQEFESLVAATRYEISMVDDYNLSKDIIRGRIRKGHKVVYE